MSEENKRYAFDEGTLSSIESHFKSLIQSKGFNVNEPSLTLDLMEHLITVLRHKHRNTSPKLSFETFLKSNISVTSGHITINAVNGAINNGSGTPPIQLQSALLRHLLIFHKQTYPVHKIVESFTNSIWSYLTVLDFKRTITGATRCHTNTRFAATTLRDYGFLRFSHKEAYKTWQLTLSGFLVAAKLIELETWVPKSTNERGLYLRQDILDAAKEVLDSYDGFVNELSKLCEPQTDIFKTYEEILNSAYKLHQFWQQTDNSKLSIRERRAKCLVLVKELEGHPDIEKFYEEFSMAILNSELMKQITGKNK
jgi:hypothetical protein